MVRLDRSVPNVHAHTHTYKFVDNSAPDIFFCVCVCVGGGYTGYYECARLLHENGCTLDLKSDEVILQ